MENEFPHINNALEKFKETIILHGADPATAGGFTQVPNFILKHPKLSAGAKITYSLLLDYARDKTSSFPGQARLAENQGISDRQVRNHINELKKEEFLKVKRRGLGKTNIYHLYLVVKKKKGSKE